jgi:RNA polymerase sigma-70 factor (ECF subfamily)
MFGFEDSVTVGELVLAAQAGSREAFTELLERYRSRVIYWAYCTLGDWSESEDICQDVSLRAWRRLHQVDRPESFAGWLKTMTHRMALSRRGRRIVRVDSDLTAAERMESREGSSLDSLLVKDTQREVREGLERLEELDRETLVAFYINDMSIQEMALAFDAPLGTIKRRLHVARHRLAEKMQSSTSV